MNEEAKYTILYVDDEESNLRIFKNTFRKEYNILTASSGRKD
jgi:response regulator RpfG family c-di-GMP phosphodiesterase